MRIPTDAGPVKWCAGCQEHWPLTSFSQDRRAIDGLGGRCKACRADARGVAAQGDKGETAFLFQMGYSPSVIAERLQMQEKSVRRHLARRGIRITGWKRSLFGNHDVYVS